MLYHYLNLFLFQGDRRIAGGVAVGERSIHFPVLSLQRVVQREHLVPAAPHIRPGIDGNPVQPGAEIGLQAEASQAAVSLQKNLLGQVLGIVVVPRQVVAQSIYLILIDYDQFFKGLFVSGLCLSDQEPDVYPIGIQP